MVNEVVVKDLERIGRISYKEFLNEFVNQNKPVILTEAAKDWPALGKWTPDFIQAKYGTKLVKPKSSKENISLHDYIEIAKSSTFDNPAPYLYSFEISELFPELLNDMLPDILYYKLDRSVSRMNPARLNLGTELLIGGPGSYFPLHYDVYFTHGFVTQIYGDKEFTLYSPQDSEYLYSNPEFPNRSLIENISDCDEQEFPKFKFAQPYRSVVKAGETIFNPAGWWHTTRLLTPCIGVVRSTVTGVNWNEFTADYFAGWPGGPLKQLSRKAYCYGTHFLMSFTETFKAPFIKG